MHTAARQSSVDSTSTDESSLFPQILQIKPGSKHQHSLPRHRGLVKTVTHEGLKTTVLGFSSSSRLLANFCSSSVFPMAPAAMPICLSSSCSLLKHRMTDPSKTSVILQISENLAPLHHCRTTSIISILNDWTYSSSTMAIPDSFETLAIRRAVSCSTRNGLAKSSFSRVVVSDYRRCQFSSRVLPGDAANSPFRQR